MYVSVVSLYEGSLQSSSMWSAHSSAVRGLDRFMIEDDYTDRYLGTRNMND